MGTISYPKTRTPWGDAQQAEKIRRGITWYSTASHGGVKLSERINERVPAYMRNRSGWYEEDCAWALAYAGLYHEHAKDFPELEDDYMAALETLRSYFWEEYERLTGATIIPGDSFSKDKHMFHVEHAGDFILTGVDTTVDGQVVCSMQLGGRQKRKIGGQVVYTNADTCVSIKLPMDEYRALLDVSVKRGDPVFYLTVADIEKYERV